MLTAKGEKDKRMTLILKNSYISKKFIDNYLVDTNKNLRVLIWESNQTVEIKPQL